MTDRGFLDFEPERDGDTAFRNFMRANLDRACRHFGLSITSAPVFGWRLRSIGAHATSDTDTLWLRVVSQEPAWASGEHWTGTVDANAITGIPKPRVLDVHEWAEGDWRHQRAEIMTFVPGQVCSPTDVLRDPIDLPASWWDELRRTLTMLAGVNTARINTDQRKITERVHERFGTNVDTTVTEWETVHGDLHWNNLHCPEFALLDWELWGRGPVGLDAATLYLYSLAQPDTPRTVHTRFTDKLDSCTGRIAQLYAAARLLRRIDQGDFPDLEPCLRDHTDYLLTESHR